MGNLKHRYQRQIQLPDFGIEGQIIFQKTKVLVFGAGGLGCPILQYLCSCGIGTIGIVDGDIVEVSNLHRQILFQEKDVGKLKASTAKEHLLTLNSECNVICYPFFATKDNILKFLEEYDIVIDGTDNFQSRYLINDACFFTQKPIIFGSIFQYEGQVTVFNVKQQDGTYSSNYRDLYPQPPKPELQVSCEEGGVIGTLPGIIGTIMAQQAINLAMDPKTCLIERLLMFNAQLSSFVELKYGRNEMNPISGKIPTQFDFIDYESFCEVESVTNIHWQKLQELIKKQSVDLIDVRTAEERSEMNIGGRHIPLHVLVQNFKPHKDLKVVVLYCRSGKRSAQGIRLLQDQYERLDFYSLDMGLEGIEQ